MIATSITYDLVFLVHIMAAVDTLIIFLVMRSSAQGVIRGADATFQRKRFPNRINWAADLSRKGLRQSAGLMVNYLYDLDGVEENHEAFLKGDIIRSRAVDRLI